MERRFRPTVVIGLGGTGLSVIRKVKSRMEQLLEHGIPPMVRFLGMDTDIRDLEKSGTEESELELAEWINIGNYDADGYLEANKNNPLIKSWWEPLEKPGMITVGAHRRRPVGRLSLFNHMGGTAGVHHRLDMTIGDVGNAQSRSSTKGMPGYDEADPALGTKIYIVSSVCGGTGAGTFLDVAHLCRHLGLQTLSIAGYLFLPEAFDGVPNVKPRELKANAYGSLTELYHYMSNPGWTCAYPDDPGNPVKVNASPFNVCYLVDATTESDIEVPDFEDRKRIVAETIAMEIATLKDLGPFLDNPGALGRTVPFYHQGEGSSQLGWFSSLNIASLYVPREKIKQSFAATFGVRILNLILGGARTGDPDKQLEAFIDRHEVRSGKTDELLKRIREDDQGASIEVQPFADAFTFKGVSANLLVSQINVGRSNWMNAIFNDETKARVRQNRQDREGRVKDAVKELVDRVLFTDYQGIDVVWTVLQGLQTYASKSYREMDAERSQFEKDLKAQRDPQAILENIRKLTSKFIKDKEDIQEQVDEYIKACHTRDKLAFEQYLRDQAMELYRELEQTAVAVQADLDTLKQRLSQARNLLQRKQQVGFTGGGLSYQIDREFADERLLMEITAKVLPDTEALLSQLDQDFFYTWSTDEDGLPDLSAKKSQKYVDALTAEGERRLEQANIYSSILDLLNIGVEDPVEHFNTMLQSVSPLWQYYDPILPQGTTDVYTVVGVSNPTHPMLKALADGAGIAGAYTPVETTETDRITVYRTRHGMPPYAIRGVQKGDYYTQYKDQIRRRALHVLPDVHRMERILPTSREELEHFRVFSLGIRFDYIYKRRTQYVLKPPEESTIQIEGRRRSEALQSLVGRPNLYAQLKALVNKREDELYEQDPDHPNAPIIAEVEDQIRELERQIQENLNAGTSYDGELHFHLSQEAQSLSAYLRDLRA